jgi:hypothetical protein
VVIVPISLLLVLVVGRPLHPFMITPTREPRSAAGYRCHDSDPRADRPGVW